MACLCVPGCTVNPNCAVHGRAAVSLDERASRGYTAFCEAARAFLPAYYPDWSLLPETVKTAWKAAAAAIVKS